MLRFTTLTLHDIHIVKPFLGNTTNRACDTTVGGIWMWRDFFQTQYAVSGHTLFLKYRFADGTTAFALPLGGSADTSLAALRRYSQTENIPLIFSAVKEDELRLLGEYFTLSARPERDWFDYLYSAEALKTLSGRRYNGQRNHINFFRRQYADCRFAELERDNLDAVRDFYERLPLPENPSNLYKEERDKVREVLDCYETYGLPGGVLYADGAVAAFAIGEIVKDTLFTHIEKSDMSRRGAAQMIVNTFARHYAQNGVDFINREEDVGDEGLRISKLSYHPCEIIKKYTVTAL